MNQLKIISKHTDIQLSALESLNLDWNVAQNFVINLENSNLDKNEIIEIKNKISSTIKNYFNNGFKKKYSNSTKNDPNLMGDVYSYTNSGEFDDALNTVNDVLKKSPDYIPALKSKIHILKKLDRFLEAIKICETLLDSDFESSISSSLSKIIFYEFPNDDYYSKFIDERIDKNTENLGWFHVKIRLNILKQNFSENISLIEGNFLALEKSQFLTELGICYGRLDKHVQAIDSLSKAIEKDSQNDFALGLRGHEYIRTEDYSLSLTDFQNAYLIHHDLRHKLSEAYVLDLVGRDDDAIKLLNLYLDSEERTNVLKVKALIYRKHRNFDISLDCYAAILDENQYSSVGLCGFALVYEELGKFDLALSSVEKVLSYEYVEFAMNLKIRILLKQEKFDDAKNNLDLLITNRSKQITNKNNELESSFNLETIQTSLKLIEHRLNESTFLPPKFILSDKFDEIKELDNLDTLSLLKENESDILEFKSSLRYDHNLKKLNPVMEQMTLKTICAFLNSSGGVLVIGYDDDNDDILGLNFDYMSLKKTNWDGWQLKLEQLIQNSLGLTFSAFVTVRRELINGTERKEIAKILVKKSRTKAFVNDNGKQRFFVRRNGQTNELDVKDSMEWCKDHNLT